MPMTIELVCVAIAAIIAIEVAVRAYGLVDFPVYDVDGKIGYIARANQRGSFLNNNDWYFNDKNMPIAQNWDASIRPNILLIGNSVVMGGNSYRQQDKLAPNIQKRLGGRPFVWPIAAGGWTQLNQMAYFAVRHPEIASHADYIAWEYMAGGLSRATPWPGEHVSPTRRPVYATWYLLQRYVAPVIPASSGARELPVTGSAQEVNIAKFDAAIADLTNGGARGRRGLIWFYPRVAELELAQAGKEWLPERRQIEKIANKHGLGVVDVASNIQWNKSLYRDDGVHPTVAGNDVLASILAVEFAKLSRLIDGE